MRIAWIHLFSSGIAAEEAERLQKQVRDLKSLLLQRDRYAFAGLYRSSHMLRRLTP